MEKRKIANTFAKQHRLSNYFIKCYLKFENYNFAFQKRALGHFATSVLSIKLLTI